MWNIEHLTQHENYQKCCERWMFLKILATESSRLLSKWRMDVTWLVWTYFFVDIFESQYLFKIYHTSLNNKNYETVVKMDVSGNFCDGER